MYQVYVLYDGSWSKVISTDDKREANRVLRDSIEEYGEDNVDWV